MSTQNQHNFYAHEYMKSGTPIIESNGNHDISGQVQALGSQEMYQVNPVYQQGFQVKNRNLIPDHNVYPLQQVYEAPNEYYSIDEYTSTVPPTHGGYNVHLTEPTSGPVVQPNHFTNYNLPVQSTTARGTNFQILPSAKQKLSKPSSSIASPSSSTSSVSERRRNSRSSMASMDHPEVTKPRIATTFWEDEHTVCYQVEARGILVSRREDSNFVNGTKLLNVIGMTRGKRDGILKSEKKKKVVKVGSMNLKGVWIPFERAAEIARNEGVDNEELLGPLFIKDISTYFKIKGYKLKSDFSNKAANLPEDVTF